MKLPFLSWHPHSGSSPTDEVTHAINRMLAVDNSRLDTVTVEVFAKIFGGGHVLDGDYVPVTVDKLRNVLSLTAGETAGETGARVRAATPAD